MSKYLQEIVTRFQGLKAIISHKTRDEFWFLKLKDLDYNSLTMQIIVTNRAKFIHNLPSSE